MPKLERPTESRRKDRDHVGFNAWGGTFRAGLPVTNVVTRFVKRLSIDAWAKKLAPSEVLEVVRVQPEHLQVAMNLPFMERWWADKVRFDDWQGLQVSSPAQATVKWYGSGQCMWVKDDLGWKELCAVEARLRQQPAERPMDPAGEVYLRRVLELE